jgi:peptidyl-prolyl cis-trans isomerase-like 2
MGKKRHTQDKLWITYKELVQDWGGKSDDLGFKNFPLKKLPFYCCSLSFMPFNDPVCLQDGTIFDLINILPYIKKFKKNPVTGLPLKASDLIKLNFSKNEDGEYHCPITYKPFTENSTIIAIKETGNVYSFEAYDTLNKKVKNYKDLLNNQSFDPKNVIIIQDPKSTNQRNVNDYDFIKKKEDVDFIRHGQQDFYDKSENFVNLSSTYKSIIDNYQENATEEQIKRQQVLNMINNKQNIEEEDERTKKIKLECDEFEKNLEKLEQEILGSSSNLSVDLQSENLKKFFRISSSCYLHYLKKNKNEKILYHDRFTEGKAAGSFTSTSLNANYSNKYRMLSDDELRNKIYYPIVKSRGLKGYVRLNTNLGFLNLMIHCDLVPKTSENFLELCESGYYNNVPFHRLVKNFVLQGGDPTGTGCGGTSYFGKAFEDEFNAKLTHKDRGTLSMANSGANTNSSQFFITLKATPHLDNRHSVFGEVVGNLKVLDDLESVGSDKKGKPYKEIKILSMEVFTNPFRDVISDLLIKDFTEKFMSENEKIEKEKERRVEENLKKMDNLENKSKMLASSESQESSVGKYLNKKRNIDSYKGSFFNSSDPYAFDKPKMKEKRGDFNFSDW